jgi:hypothetical protein
MIRAFFWRLSVGRIIGFSMKNDKKVDIRHKKRKIIFFLREGIWHDVGLTDDYYYSWFFTYTIHVLKYPDIILLSKWPRGLKCGSTAARLLVLRVRIPPWAWMDVCCECSMLSGRGLCLGPIIRPEDSYSVIVKPWWGNPLCRYGRKNQVMYPYTSSNNSLP